MEVEQQAAAGFHRFLPAVGFFQHQQDFADAEEADYHDDELDTVGQADAVEGEAVHTGGGVHPDSGQSQTDQR
ncbi:hypothetical protein D9M68_1003800 [compost metagenome]